MSEVKIRVFPLPFRIFTVVCRQEAEPVNIPFEKYLPVSLLSLSNMTADRQWQLEDAFSGEGKLTLLSKNNPHATELASLPAANQQKIKSYQK